MSSARRRRCSSMPSWNSSATKNAMPSCAGGRPRSRTSPSFRRIPASFTRSIWNTWRASSSSARNGETGKPLAYPDTLVGTDSHTTMINGLGVLGWGVGGIEAEAAMLGQPVSMLIPQVVGVPREEQASRRLDRDRPRSDRYRDAAQEGRSRQVRRILRARAAELSRSPIAPPSATWRRSTAQPAASSRSTRRRCTTCASAAAAKS